ncbi:MAG: hypothetical protein ACXAC5_04365 [Promethearchaeota archaeon]|jgi:hypothetical protein
MKQRVLVKFRDNYADEFDIEGWKIMCKESWDNYVKAMKKDVVWPQSKYFGTNEGIEWSDADEHLYCFKAIPITPEEEQIIVKVIGKRFGDFLAFDLSDKYEAEELKEARTLW